VYKQNTTEPEPLIEGTEYPADPEDGYGWEKLFMERMCRHFSEDFGIEVRIVRYHNVYGPVGTWQGGREKAPAALCRKIIEATETESHKITVWGDGEQTRSFLYIDDAVEGTIRVMNHTDRTAFNIGSDRQVSINQLVDIIETFVDKKVEREYIEGPLGVRGRNSDNTKVKSVLNWEPQITLEEGLHKTFMWIREQYRKQNTKTITTTAQIQVDVETLPSIETFVEDKPIHIDFRYYTKWNFDELFVPEKYDGSAGYAILKPWPGGFNNIRMSLELAVCAAYISNRVLVLPPKYKMYLLQDEFGLEDFFDMSDVGIKTMTLNEFCQLHNIETSFDAAAAISSVTDAHENHILNFTEETPPADFLKTRQLADMVGLFNSNRNVFFNKNLLGNFYMKIYSKIDKDVRKLIARHVHYLPSIFDMAQKAINFLGDKHYYAIHIRRNDFQYKHLFISPEEILDNIKDIIPEGSRLYIATDHRDIKFFIPFRKKYKVFFYHDIEPSLETQHHYNYVPIIEQLICTRAIKFVGNDFSTLSSYAYRLRGYMNDIEDKNYYINTKPFDEKDQLLFTETERFTGNWTREFKDGWEF